MNGCKECIAYMLHNGGIDNAKCLDCGNMSLQWVQSEDGTFGLECSVCGAKIACDLNTPCEMDDYFDSKIVITLLPQNQIPDNKSLLCVAKLFGVNALTLKKIMVTGTQIEMDIELIEKAIEILKAANILYQVDDYTDQKEKYPYYRDCKYPYSRMNTFLNSDSSK